MLRKVFDSLYLRLTKPEKRPEYYRRKGICIGEGGEIYEDVCFGSEPYLISLGDNVRVTAGCRFITHDGGVWTLRKMGLVNDAEIFGEIQVGNNVHIGTSSIIMPGVTIGDNCIIGCGSIVTKSIPSGSVAVGIPARVVRTISEYHEMHKDSFDYTKHLNALQKREYLINKYNQK